MEEQKRRQPQDDIPYEVWMKHILKAYRKDKEKMEQLRRYADGLEEENVALKKELDQMKPFKKLSLRRGKEVFDLNRKVKSQEMHIVNLELLLAQHNIPTTINFPTF